MLDTQVCRALVIYTVSSPYSPKKSASPRPEVRPLYYGMLLFSQATATVAGGGASLLNTSSSARTAVGGVKAWTVPPPAKKSVHFAALLTVIR